MTAKSSSAITVTVVLLAGIFSAPSARAQDASASSLADELKTQYKLAKMGTDSNITEVGTVLVIQTDGILGVPPGSVATCQATYSDGVLHAPSGADQTRCGKDARKLNIGEKVYALKIEVNSKTDTVSLLVAGCGSCNGTSQPTSYKSQIVFQFPNGYLAAAAVDQIGDVISQVLKVDNGTNDAQRQVHGGQSSSAVLTNDDIIKLVQAKLPDSVVLAKIKSSSCDFHTSSDALIKLQHAGVSNSVLQAMVEAPPPPTPPDPGENPPTVSAGLEKPRSSVCADYDACVRSGATLFEGGLSDQSLARFQEASQLDPSRGEAWAGIGNAYFQMGQYDDAVSMWDKALQLGSTLSMDACHAGALCGDKGTFLLSTREVSFLNKKGEKEFAAAPSALSSEGAVLFNGSGPAYYLQLRFGKNWRFYYTPKTIRCNLGFVCPEPGPTQQKIFADYIHGALVRMAAGDFGSRPHKP